MALQEYIGGHFRIQQRIGGGGAGEVYLGYDSRTQQKVAIKILKEDVTTRDPHLVERFKHEADILKQLDHPHIVKIIAAGEENQQHYLVMEYLEGGTLNQLIARENPMPITRVLEIGLDIADALTRAHRLNIIHRDLKPSNVIFSDGVPHLTDFGIARLGGESDITQTGLVMGSYHYLSPEACDGKPVDERADIWSFGVLLYEMLTGRPPFEGNAPGVIVNNIMNTPPPPITRPDVPPALADFIYRMLDKNPERRISSMRVVGSELEQFLRQQQTSSFSDQKLTRFPTTTSGTFARGRSTTGLLVSVLALVALAAAVFVWRSSQDEKKTESAAPIVAVEPAAPGETMILVAQLEPIDTPKREIVRFILDDLKLTLEDSVPYLHVRVREYPHVLKTPAEAQAAAEKNQAAIIIWGNYTADTATLNIQVGSLQALPYILVDRGLLENSLNVRVQLQDPQNESIAAYVVGDLIVLQTANGETFEAAGSFLSLDLVEVQSAAMVNQNTAAELHRFFNAFWDSPEDAVEILEKAILDEKSNPILYHFRGLAYQRLGEREKADQDLDTAARLSNDKWYASYVLRAGRYFIANDPEPGIAHLDQVVDKNPTDWFMPYLRGTLYFLNKDYAAAEADYETANQLDPSMNFPYISLSQLAIRQGQLERAADLMSTLLANYTDPSLINRILLGIYGLEGNEGALYTFQLSAYGNFIAGQYDAAVDDVDAALRIDPKSVDLFFLKGISLCSLEEYEAAEAAYTEGIKLDPDFIVLYLLRAEVRSAQKDLAGALEDVNFVRASELGPQLEPFIEMGLTGEFSCKDFLQNQ